MKIGLVHFFNTFQLFKIVGKFPPVLVTTPRAHGLREVVTSTGGKGLLEKELEGLIILGGGNKYGRSIKGKRGREEKKSRKKREGGD